MNSVISETESSVSNREQKAPAASIKAQPIGSPADYVDLYEVVLFFRKWRLLMITLMAVGLGCGSILSYVMPTYYTSTLNFSIDERHAHTLQKPEEMNAVLGEMFRQKHFAEAFASHFFGALKNNNNLDGSERITTSSSRSSHQVLIATFARYAASHEPSTDALPGLAQAKLGLANYLMRYMTAYLAAPESIPSSGFLFMISANKSKWQLQARLNAYGLMDDVAYASVDALNRVIAQRNDEAYQSALVRKQTQLAERESVLNSLKDVNQNLNHLEAEKLKAKVDLVAIDYKLHRLALKEPRGNSYLDGFAEKPVFESKLFDNNSAAFRDILDAVLVEKIIKKTSVLLDNLVISRQQADAVLDELVKHSRKKVELANAYERQNSLLERSRADYNATLLDIKVNLASQVPRVASAELNHDDIAEANILGQLEVENKLHLKFLVLGSVAGFLLACTYALIQHSYRRLAEPTP